MPISFHSANQFRPSSHMTYYNQRRLGSNEIPETRFFAPFASPKEGGSSWKGYILLHCWTDFTAAAARMVVLKGIPSVLSPELLYALAKMGHGDELGMTRVK